MKLENVGTRIQSGKILWKYFDLQKLLSFMLEQRLVFSRMDTLDDLNEAISQRQLKQNYGTTLESVKAALDDFRDELSGRRHLSIEKRQKECFVSCWARDHRESVAMWNLYSNQDGIAICVKIGELLNILKNAEVKRNDMFKKIQHGAVVYKDFHNPKHRESFKDQIENIGFQKDACFSYEKEYRFFMRDFRGKTKSKLVKVDIPKFEELKATIVFHPKMKEWKKQNIKLLIKKLGYDYISFKDSEVKLR